MKRRFQIIQVMQDGSEERYVVTARNYSTCWRNRVQWAKGLERTRSIVVHELETVQLDATRAADDLSEAELEIGRNYGIKL